MASKTITKNDIIKEFKSYNAGNFEELLAWTADALGITQDEVRAAVGYGFMREHTIRQELISAYNTLQRDYRKDSECYKAWQKRIDALEAEERLLPKKNIQLTMYAVRNEKGQFFRAKGQSGMGDTWVKDIQTAKIYGKIGPARKVVTYFANAYKKFPILEILEMTTGNVKVLVETDRVRKAMGHELTKEQLSNQQPK